MDITLWTINRAVDLLHGQDRAIRKRFAKRSIHAAFGERDVSGAHSNESPRQLMPSVEYFVPVPLKCIGSKYLATGLDAEGQALLEGIRTRYDYFQEKEKFDGWWQAEKSRRPQAVEDTFGRQRMITPHGVGYYELIEQHPNNVLVGYSQGGMVARYLAFLDRYVFKRNVVKAVFTVGAPNYGSPLANPFNKENVTAGLFQFMVSLLSFHADAFPTFHKEIDLSVTFEELYAGLSAALGDSRRTGHDAQHLLETAIKWLSGLKDDKNSAFCELNARNHDEPFSVLALINAGKYQAADLYTGAVLTANENLDEILRSVLVDPRPRTLGERFKRFLTKKAIGAVKKKKVFGIPMSDNLHAAGQLYARTCMREITPDGHPSGTLERLIHDYREGVRHLPKAFGDHGDIPPYAHDFVIPSVYQRLPDHPSLLGHYVNLDASHNSGSSPDFPAGRDNVDALLKLFDKLAHALLP